MEAFAIQSGKRSVSRLGIGCEQLGGVDWGDYDSNDAVRAVKAAMEHGVNLFDTANVYGLGLSETRLAEALGSARHDAFIVTKGGFRWDGELVNGRAHTRLDLRPGNIRRSVEDSLERLRLEVLPLYLIHWPTPDMDIGALVETLANLRELGRIERYGFSNFSLDQLRAASMLAPIDAVEIEYNLLTSDAGHEIIQWCSEKAVMTLAYGALGQGLLTGKYDRHSVFPPSDRRHRLRHFSPERLPSNLAAVERVVKLAKRLGRRPSQVAVRWCLDSAPLDAAIVGVKNLAQLDDLVGASDWKLTSADLEYLVAPG